MDPMENTNRDATAGKLMFLLFGELLGALSIYFIKSSTMNPLLLASGRQLTAALVLLPLFFKEMKQNKDFRPGDLKISLIPGVLLGIHFITWITGARMIPGANATLIVNLTPAVTPLLLYFLTRERTNRQEGIGSVLALSGSFVLAFSDLALNRDYFLGDLICFVSMLTLAAYLVFSKRSMKGIWTYLVPLYLTGGTVCFLASFFTTNPFRESLTRADWIAILGMGIVSTLGGHSIINWAMKHLRGQIVSLFHNTQFIYAGLIGFFVFKEIPRGNFFVAAVLIILGLIYPLLPKEHRAS